VTRRILLAVDGTTEELWPDDRVFAEALEARGVEPVPHRWGRPVADGAVVVIRSTWDYVERPAAFVAWLDHLDERGATVVNPTGLLRWNLHKRYLLELADGGVPIVPTELVGRATSADLGTVAGRRGWSDVVVKPAVGGSARLTVHSGRVGWETAASHFARLVAAEDVLVQPVVSSVADAGEVSVIAIDGEPLAAVVKYAAQGDWRVQSDFGGTAVAVALTEAWRELALRALRSVPTPVYARVDLVHDRDGWAVMELELIEPELFFPLVPTVAARLADHVVAAADLRH
jgi:glutathione synthase/RimK-type ligase-like ATP-grasp enzyme